MSELEAAGRSEDALGPISPELYGADVEWAQAIGRALEAAAGADSVTPGQYVLGRVLLIEDEFQKRKDVARGGRRRREKISVRGLPTLLREALPLVLKAAPQFSSPDEKKAFESFITWWLLHVSGRLDRSPDRAAVGTALKKETWGNNLQEVVLIAIRICGDRPQLLPGLLAFGKAQLERRSKVPSEFDSPWQQIVELAGQDETDFDELRARASRLASVAARRRVEGYLTSRNVLADIERDRGYFREFSKLYAVEIKLREKVALAQEAFGKAFEEFCLCIQDSQGEWLPNGTATPERRLKVVAKNLKEQKLPLPTKMWIALHMLSSDELRLQLLDEPMEEGLCFAALALAQSKTRDEVPEWRDYIGRLIRTVKFVSVDHANNGATAFDPNDSLQNAAAASNLYGALEQAPAGGWGAAGFTAADEEERDPTAGECQVWSLIREGLEQQMRQVSRSVLEALGGLAQRHRDYADVLAPRPEELKMMLDLLRSDHERALHVGRRAGILEPNTAALNDRACPIWRQIDDALSSAP